MYRWVYLVVLRRVPAETAHRVAFELIRGLGVARLIGARWLRPRDPVLRVRALGLEFAGPVGVAAGFDKDARGVRGLGALGFGFVEVGTVTALPQPGNERPRMFRLPADRALVNRMGFNNSGAAAAAARLRGRWRGGPVVGVNIGKSRAVAEQDAAADYAASARMVATVADYVVVNVSSPNTPGLRDLQGADRLRPVLVAVREALDEALDEAAGRRVPLLVKIAPDLADADIDALADLALELGLDGIVATNTTVSRDGLASPAAEVAAAGAGGLSGAPLRPRALAVLGRLRARAGDRLVLIAAGGIETPQDAWERLRAGATLVQAYTGFVYGGPLWPRRMHAGLAHLTRAEGLSSVGEAGRGPASRPIAPPLSLKVWGDIYHGWPAGCRAGWRPRWPSSSSPSAPLPCGCSCCRTAGCPGTWMRSSC
jgi:dihydroorotate dehydrogenase